MTTLQDQCYSDCLQALKDEAILLHPLDVEDDKALYLKFKTGYKENVPYGVWQRLVKHPRVKGTITGKWLVYKYIFEGEYNEIPR